MCGISGCLVGNGCAMNGVLQALNKLQNRGYDSAGIATILDNKLFIKKSVSRPGENAMEDINNDPLANVTCQIAIGHTRWATHGPKTMENAHPHTDDDMRFSIVHNGIIENYMELKEELLNVGYQFYGQTDTEIVVKYLHYLMDNGKTYSDLYKHMKGSWDILILDTLEPKKIYFSKNGSPLIIGFDKSKSKVMFVSELVGFDPDITEYFPISDNDFGSVSINDSICEIITNLTYVSKPITNLITETTPSPYSHWTLKEINDQPIALSRLLLNRIKYSDNLGYDIIFPELESFSNDLYKVEHLIFLACGTSYHAAQIGVKFFKELQSNMTMEVIDGADFEDIDIPKNRNTMLVLLSQSGETKDLYRALVIGKAHGTKSIGLINVEDSLIAREVDCCLYLKAGREHAVASTKSFTNQVVMLLLFALWMNSREISSKDQTNLRSKYFSALIKLSCDFDQIIKKSSIEIPNMLGLFKDQNNCFILGKNICEWIAKEGSLKIKEISYIHAEGYSAAALKHGPFALLTDNIPIILLANNDKFFSKIENVTSEVKSRCAKVIYITNKLVHSDNIDYQFFYDTDSVLFPLLTIVPLQILSYHLSLDRGNHPDYPRNLAKVVTVE